MVAVQNLKGEIIQLILSRKGGGGMYLVSATPTKRLIECLSKFTVAVHNLQMCMKEYRWCLKFRRGDNSTYTFTKRGVVYLISATPPKRLIGVLCETLHSCSTLPADVHEGIPLLSKI